MKILLFFTCLIIWPISLIWSLNTLFPGLEIPVTWRTWVAMFLVWQWLSHLRKPGSDK